MPLAGLSEITTPEKSSFLRTAGSRESFSSTRPETVAATSGSAARALKKVRETEIIMIVESISSTQIGSARLRSFEPSQYVLPDVIDQIRGVGLIARNSAG